MVRCRAGACAPPQQKRARPASDRGTSVKDTSDGNGLVRGGYMTTADKHKPARGINVKKRTDTVTVRNRLMQLISDLLRQTPWGWVLLIVLISIRFLSRRTTSRTGTFRCSHSCISARHLSTDFFGTMVSVSGPLSPPRSPPGAPPVSGRRSPRCTCARRRGPRPPSPRGSRRPP